MDAQRLTFIMAVDGMWHIFGITHPLVETKPRSIGIYEWEYASYYAESAETSFKETVKENHFNYLSEIRAPIDRPGEMPANHAPYIIRKDGLFQLVYGHNPIRLAMSSNLYDWEPKGKFFSDPHGTRLP